MKILLEEKYGEAILVQPQCPIQLDKCKVKITSGPNHGQTFAVRNVKISYNRNMLWIQIDGTDYKYLPSQFVIVKNEAGETAQRQLESEQNNDERFRHGEKRVYKRFIRLLQNSLRFVHPDLLGEVVVDNSYQEKKRRDLDLTLSDIPGLLSDGKYERMYLGRMTDQEYEDVYKPAADKFTARRFYQWHDEFVKENKRNPSRADLAIELVEFGVSYSFYF